MLIKLPCLSRAPRWNLSEVTYEMSWVDLTFTRLSLLGRVWWWLAARLRKGPCTSPWRWFWAAPRVWKRNSGALLGDFGSFPGRSRNVGAGRKRPVFSSLFLTQHKMKGSAHLWIRSGRNSDHSHLRRRVFVLLPPGMAGRWAVKVKFQLKVHMWVTS